MREHTVNCEKCYRIDLHEKEQNEFSQEGRVKRMVASIEKSMSITCKMCPNTQHSGPHDTTKLSDILNYLLELQIHLRHDLNDIDWPSVFVGRITQTSITFANVNITDD